jgi:hypothetical protein
MWGRRQYPTRFLGNNNPNGDHEFHDLNNENSNCQVSEIIDNNHDVPFETKADAKKAGYDPCDWCMPGESTR